MATKFSDFSKQVEKEARAEGTRVVAELEAFRAHFALASQLAELRKKNRLTQTELAKRSGVPQSEISRIERGHANPTVSTLAALAKPLKVAGIAFVKKDTALP